jgi:hypothetical protein
MGELYSNYLRKWKEMLEGRASDAFMASRSDAFNPEKVGALAIEQTEYAFGIRMIEDLIELNAGDINQFMEVDSE